jgi:hypothetical protein
MEWSCSRGCSIRLNTLRITAVSRGGMAATAANATIPAARAYSTRSWPCIPESGDEELHIASFSQKHGSDPTCWNESSLLDY